MHNPYELVTIAIHERLKLGEQHPYWQTLLMKAWPKEGEMAKTLGEPIGDGNPIRWLLQFWASVAKSSNGFGNQC
jgi:hypothetical protein